MKSAKRIFYLKKINKSPTKILILPTLYLRSKLLLCTPPAFKYWSRNIEFLEFWNCTKKFTKKWSLYSLWQFDVSIPLKALRCYCKAFVVISTFFLCCFIFDFRVCYLRHCSFYVFVYVCSCFCILRLSVN